MSPVPPLFAFLDSLGGFELAVIALITLLLFGGDKLPGLARGISRTMRELKKATSSMEQEFKKAIDDSPPPPPAAPAAPLKVLPPEWEANTILPETKPDDPPADSSQETPAEGKP